MPYFSFLQRPDQESNLGVPKDRPLQGRAIPLCDQGIQLIQKRNI